MIEKHKEEEIRRKYEALASTMDERARRLWAAAESLPLGHGGIACVERATEISRTTIRFGREELSDPEKMRESEGRVRRPGAGRPFLLEQDPQILEELEALVEPMTRGDPMSPLRWTCKSTRKLSAELAEIGHSACPNKVRDLLLELGYRLQKTKKNIEGTAHPDRNAQFEYINRRVTEFQRAGEPVISVDTKKKELVGNYTNAGSEWHPSGQPPLVNVHDFPDPEVPKAIPYGVYDLLNNEGWVNVGTDHDTPAFAVQSIRQWWMRMGRFAFPDATKLLIAADAGGSNGYRLRVLKTELQSLADTLDLPITICHFPPGTSKWNKIEHRMFCHITENWRGQPLVSYEVIVNLIGSTTTETGLRIKAKIDHKKYPTGIKVSDEELAKVKIRRARFHGDWNYTICPQ